MEESRPLLIELRSERFKREVMNNLSKLRSAEDEFRKVGVAHDLSPVQREDIKKTIAVKKAILDDTGEVRLGKLSFQGGREHEQIRVFR